MNSRDSNLLTLSLQLAITSLVLSVVTFIMTSNYCYSHNSNDDVTTETEIIDDVVTTESENSIKVSDLPVYAMSNDRGYNEALGNTFYITSEEPYAIPLESSGWVNPSQHQSDWMLTTLVDGGTDTEYLIIYNKNNPAMITTIERRKYEEQPLDFYFEERNLN